MLEIVQTLLKIYRDFNGNGMLFAAFGVAIIYLWVTALEEDVRVVLLYLSAAILAVFACPLFAYVMIYHFMEEDEIYYRILWLVPIFIVIAYAAVAWVSTRKGKLRQLLSTCIIFVVIIVSGRNVYTTQPFVKADNPYQLPQAVCDIFDYIEVEDRQVRAVFPAEILQYVRQYSANIWMPYGREMLVDRWGNQDDLYDEMETVTIQAETLCKELHRSDCEYVILNALKGIEGDMSLYGYTKIETIGGYDIYKQVLQ